MIHLGYFWYSSLGVVLTVILTRVIQAKRTDVRSRVKNEKFIKSSTPFFYFLLFLITGTTAYIIYTFYSDTIPQTSVSI